MNIFDKEETYNMEEVFEFLDQNFRREKLNVTEQVFIHDKKKMENSFMHVGKYLREGEGRLLGTFLKRIRNS